MFYIGSIRPGISIPQGSLRLVRLVVSIFVDILLGFPKSWDLLFSKCHFTEGSQANSKRCHFVLLMMTCPPVALADPANTLRTSWAILTVSSSGVFGEGGI